MEKSAETIVCNGNYAENIEDLLEGYIAEKCGLNGENHIEVIIDDVSDTDVDFDDHRSTVIPSYFFFNFSNKQV